MRAKGAVLNIDAGDSMFASDSRRRGSLSAQMTKKAEVMAEFLGYTKTDAAALGDLDLCLGAEESAALLGSRGLSPVLSNVRFANPAVKTVRQIAWSVSGYRFLALNLFGKKAIADVEGATWEDPIAAFDAQVKAAGDPDVVLVACHRLDEATVRKLAERNDVLKILIDADGSSRLRASGVTTRTMVVKPPDRGAEILIGELYLRHGAPAFYMTGRYAEAVKSGKPLDAEAAAASECDLVDFEEMKLDAKYPDDPAIAKLMTDYKAWSRQATLDAPPDVPGAPPYVGAEACGACHKEQLANWKSSYHAKAWETLVKDPDGGAQDPECISCHSSGFLQPGGPRKIEDIGPFQAVQCESCHAPLAKHPGGGKHPKVAEALCVACHSETRDPNFVFATYLKYATCTRPHDPAANRVPRK